MGLIPHVITGMGIAGLLLVLSLSDLATGGCVFESNTHLVLRNTAILAKMDSTLFNYTTAAQGVISQVSNFNIEAFILQTFSVNRTTYLVFVSVGKLLTINWTQVTSNATTNGTIDCGLFLSSYIKQKYIDPVHVALQGLANYYSFSVGIFRPNQTRFQFSGLATDSNDIPALDLNCSAGSGFVWRLSTNLTYDDDFDNVLSTKYAILASTIENAFDRYYRNNTVLKNSFVRANFINATKKDSSGTWILIGYMEVYFLNNTYQADYINSSTNYYAITDLIYSDGDSTRAVIGLNDGKYTRINHTLSMTSPTVAALPVTAPVLSPTSCPSTISIQPDGSVNQTATINSTSQATSVQSAAVSSDNSTGLPLTVGTNATAPMSSPTLSVITGLLTVSPLQGSSASNAPLDTINLTSETVPTSTPSSASNTNQASTLPLALSTTSATTTYAAASSNFNVVSTSYAQTPNFTATLLTGLVQTNLNVTTSGSLTLENQSPSTSSNGTSIQFSTFTGDQTYPISAGTTSSSIGNESGTSGINLNVGGTTYSVNTGGNTNNGGTTYAPVMATNISDAGGKILAAQTGTSVNDRGTTFDPDPLFQANAPVIAKIYNDYFLLRKLGTMSPITEKATFFSITLPTSIGIIAAVIMCMLFWQTDCLFRQRKV